MAVALSPQTTWFSGGVNAAGGSLYVYNTGGTTLQTIYSDGNLTIPITNPIVLDANGNAVFYVGTSTALKLQAFTITGVLIETLDPVYPISGSQAIIGTTVVQSTSLAITSANTGNNIVASAAITLTLPLTTTLPTNFYIDFNAKSGAITFTPQGTDAIQGGSVGTNYIVPKATSGRLWTDANGNWGVNFFTAVLTTEATLVSASTVDLGTASSNIVDITGTTTITSFGSTAQTSNPLYFIRFTGILTLTYNASSLIIPGAANITTAAGDTAIIKYEGSGNWRVINYMPASGKPVIAPPSGALILLNTVNASAAASVAFNSTFITSTYQRYIVMADSVDSSSASDTGRMDLTFSTNNGGGYLNTGYLGSSIAGISGGTTVSGADGGTASIQVVPTGYMHDGNTTAKGRGFRLELLNPSASAPTSCFFQGTASDSTPHLITYTGSGVNTGTTAINNIKFTLSSGNTITGNFHLYGVVN